MFHQLISGLIDFGLPFGWKFVLQAGRNDVLESNGKWELLQRGFDVVGSFLLFVIAAGIGDDSDVGSILGIADRIIKSLNIVRDTPAASRAGRRCSRASR